jgi:uncharacterized protein YodC (DUF2158 family)
MTVVGSLSFDMSQNTYLCQWFAGKVYRQATFPKENLKLSAPENTQKRIAKPCVVGYRLTIRAATGKRPSRFGAFEN